MRFAFGVQMHGFELDAFPAMQQPVNGFLVDGGVIGRPEFVDRALQHLVGRVAVNRQAGAVDVGQRARCIHRPDEIMRGFDQVPVAALGVRATALPWPCAA